MMRGFVTDRGAEVARNVALQRGEWILFCENCDWVCESKMAAMKPECPQCGSTLQVIKETE